MPQKGVSPNLVEEEDAFEYAFVGDITEVRTSRFTFPKPLNQNHIRSC